MKEKAEGKKQAGEGGKKDRKKEGGMDKPKNFASL